MTAADRHEAGQLRLAARLHSSPEIVRIAQAHGQTSGTAPGFFLTEQNRRLLTNEDGSLTERSHKIISHTPMRRFGKPEDLLGALMWLVDDSASGFVTGVTIPVDGGFMAYSGV